MTCQLRFLIVDTCVPSRQAIDFAKEQADEDLWEDLLKYSETKPRESRTVSWFGLVRLTHRGICQQALFVVSLRTSALK